MSYKEVEKTEVIEGLFSKMKVIMQRNPSAIKNAQMKWILKLNKTFKNKGSLTDRQISVLKDISVQVIYNERVMS